METKLRKQFLYYSMLMFTLVVIVVGFIVNTLTKSRVSNIQNITLETISDNDGLPLKNDHFDDISSIDGINLSIINPIFFSVLIEEKEMINTYNTENVHNLDYLIDYAQNSKESEVENYKFLVTEKDNSTLIVFLDVSRENFLEEQFLYLTILVSLIALVIVFIVIFLISKIVVRPFVENNKKQKQFITNVSHEFKTPITTIKTSTEVIELTQGESDFSKTIHKNVDRLNELINNLVSYNKYEEELNVNKENVNLSKILKSITDDFLVVRENVEVKIEKDVYLRVNEEMIVTLINIFLENILKHSDSSKAVKISLYKVNKTTYLEFSNYAEGLSIKKYDKLFDRFYRLDKSRSSKVNSFGIGLSQAKRICELNKASLTAYSNDGLTLVFRVKF